MDILSIVVPDSVRTCADLKGKALAVDALTTCYPFVLEQMLADHGLPRNDYRLQSAGGVLERWNALLSGKFSGTLLVTPFDILSQAHGFHPLGYAIDDLRHYQGAVGAARRACGEILLDARRTDRRFLPNRETQFARCPAR